MAATTEVEDKTKAAIEIKATIKGDYLVVKVNNTFSALKKKNQSKGYGLDILRNLVEKYNGQMNVVVKDGNYSTSISVKNIELNEKNASL